MIKPLGNNKYYIKAEYCPKKIDIVGLGLSRKTFQGERLFTGTYNAAVREYSRIYEEQVTKFKAWVKKETKPICTFGDLIHKYREVKRPGPRQYGLLNRLEYDCRSFAVDNLHVCFNGGIHNNKEIVGYIKLLDSAYRRQFIPGKGTVEIPKKLNNASKNAILWMAEKVCDFGYRNGILQYYPFQNKKRWITKARNVVLSAEAKNKLLNIVATEYPEKLPYILYLSYNPSRVGDIRKLTKADFNPFTMRIRFISAKTKVETLQPVPAVLYDYFRSIPDDCPYLFYRPSKKYGYRPIGDIKKAWHDIRTKAGLPWLRLEDFRHIAATWLLSKNLTAQEIMGIGGWKRIETLNRYHNMALDETVSSAEKKLKEVTDNIIELKQNIQN